MKKIVCERPRKVENTNFSKNSDICYSGPFTVSGYQRPIQVLPDH